MDLKDFRQHSGFENAGQQMHRLMSDLYPICRSITGEGFRQSINILRHHIPLAIHEIPSGTRVFDWTIPKEWNISDAYVKNGRGETVVDFKASNLHVLQYSTSIKGKFSLAKLKEHIFTLPERPDWVPYRTSYYKENWGFCLSQKQLDSLQDEEYEVLIESSLKQGSLTYGEYYIQGETKDEVLLSCHSCHPSLCNDNLSGMVLSLFLAKFLTPLSLRYSYRFLFIPGAIGSIAWLSENHRASSRIKHGLVVACVGDKGTMTYKRSRRGNAEIDRAVEYVLKHSGQKYDIRDFSPYGYDERQYCSPGFDLPVGSLTRTPHGEFPEYHTSADNLGFVQPQYLEDSFAKYLAVIHLLENNRTFRNQSPKCEPQLGKRGLYRSTGGQADQPGHEMAMLWVLNLSDGRHSLLDISERSGMSFDTIVDAAVALSQCGLLKEQNGKKGTMRGNKRLRGKGSSRMKRK